MILLWGVPGDVPMDRIRAGLAARGARTCFVDQRFGPVQELERSAQAETLIRHDGRGSVDLASVRAAYIRPIATEQACTFHGADDPARVRVAAVEVRLLAWADCGPATVIN